MKNKTLRILTLFVLLSTIVSAQISGKVYSVLNLGSIDYAYIFVEEDGYYKTSAYPTGLLNIDDPVEIQPGNIPGSNFRNFIKTSNGNVGVYGEKIETEVFTMPSTSRFGSPVYADDILWFQSKEHFDEFFQILTDFSRSPYESREQLLSVFERQFPSFNSFGKKLRQKYDLIEVGVTDDQLEEYHREDYFKDDVLKSLVNKYSEIGVGNHVHTLFKSSDQQQCITLITKKEDLPVLKTYRDFVKDEWVFVRYPKLPGSYDVDGKGDPFITKDSYAVNVSGDLFPDLTYTSTLKADPVECTTNKVKIKYTVIRATQNDAHEVIDQALFDGDLTVFWGDGTQTTVPIPPIPVDINPSGDATLRTSVLFLTHTYPTDGIYSISTSAVITSEWTQNPTQFTLSDTEDWQSPDLACTNDSWSGRIQPDPQPAPDHRLVCEGSITNWWLANTIYGKITNYKKINGTWKKRQENLSVYIEGNFRNDDCDWKEFKSGFDSGHERDIVKSKTKWWINRYVANGDCFATYTYEHNGTVYTETLVFNPCVE